MKEGSSKGNEGGAEENDVLQMNICCWSCQCYGMGDWNKSGLYRVKCRLMTFGEGKVHKTKCRTVGASELCQLFCFITASLDSISLCLKFSVISMIVREQGL